MGVAHKIAVAIQKGGVGKTTLTVIASEILAAAGYKVLILDLDSQGNATAMVTGNDIYEYSGRTILEAMKEMNAEDYIVHANENLDIIPAEDMLTTFSRYIYTQNVAGKLHLLRNTIEDIEDRYDYIFIDCPPNLGDLTLNALSYADYYICPIQLGGFCLTALDRFVSFIDGAKSEGLISASLLGILFTMKDRSRTEREIGENIRERYGDMVFYTEVKKRAKIKEFSLTGASMVRKTEVDALQDYISLVEEVVERIEGMSCNEK